MGFATSPFTLEPVRSNEFKQAQISKEIYSLTSHIDTIQKEIELVKGIKERNDAVEREKLEAAKKRVAAAAAKSHEEALIGNNAADDSNHDVSHFHFISLSL